MVVNNLFQFDLARSETHTWPLDIKQWGTRNRDAYSSLNNVPSESIGFQELRFQ